MFSCSISEAQAERLLPSPASTRLSRIPPQIRRGGGAFHWPASMLESESQVSPSVPHLEYIRFNEKTERRVVVHARTCTILAGTTTQICSCLFFSPVVTCRVTFNRGGPRICRPFLRIFLRMAAASGRHGRERIPQGWRLCLLPHEPAP